MSFILKYKAFNELYSTSWKGMNPGTMHGPCTTLTSGGRACQPRMTSTQEELPLVEWAQSPFHPRHWIATWAWLGGLGDDIAWCAKSGISNHYGFSFSSHYGFFVSVMSCKDSKHNSYFIRMAPSIGSISRLVITNEVINEMPGIVQILKAPPQINGSVAASTCQVESDGETMGKNKSFQTKQRTSPSNRFWSW